MKAVTILGSTGSIGTQSLEVIRHLGPAYRVAALAARSNIDILEQQIHEFRPDIAAVYDEEKALELQRRVPHTPILAGMEGLLAAAAYAPSQMVVSAITGTLGLAPTLAAIDAGKDVGLANKEALVTGGALVISRAAAKKIALIPVDSEHNAIFQCLKGENPRTVRRLILTASGGPFRTFSQEQLEAATIEQALQHPNWKMGPKVTIDCSTLMNKGLEMIEAYWLFGVPVENIEVAIHPQSLVHSLVEFTDMTTLAQISEPSMLLPIQYALTYPERKPGLSKPFDLTRARTLEFFPPDMQKFRCLALAYEAIRQGGSLPAYMNAANEVLVDRFLNKECSWGDIGRKLEILMGRHRPLAVASYEEVAAVDREARAEAAVV